MEVGQVIRVAEPPASSRDSGGTYRVPVKIQGSIRQALVDSGCNTPKPGSTRGFGGGVVVGEY